MKDKYIYLVSGKALHGKDSIYKEGVDLFSWRRVAFADKLKEILIDLYGLSHDQVYGNKKEELDYRYINNLDPEFITSEESTEIPEGLKLPKNVKFDKIRMVTKNIKKTSHLSPRKMAIALGKSQRDIYDAVWAAYVFRKVVPPIFEQGVCKNIIVTDVRFPNEIKLAEAFVDLNKDIQLVKVRVERPNFDNKLTDIEKQDVSETSLDNYNNWNFIVKNDASLESLQNKLKQLKLLAGTSDILPINLII
jgi:hypothetical protein